MPTGAFPADIAAICSGVLILIAVLFRIYTKRCIQGNVVLTIIGFTLLGTGICLILD